LYPPRAIDAVLAGVREPTTPVPCGLNLARLSFCCHKQQPIPTNIDAHRRRLLFRA
jgi:hypothetical protein